MCGSIVSMQTLHSLTGVFRVPGFFTTNEHPSYIGKNPNMGLKKEKLKNLVIASDYERGGIGGWD